MLGQCCDLSAEDKNIQVHIHVCFFGGWEGVMLCGIKVECEQVSLKSFEEDGM